MNLLRVTFVFIAIAVCILHVSGKDEKLATNDKCKDREKRKCKKWFKRGYCQKYPKLIEKYCAMTCGFCEKLAPCAYTKNGCCWDLSPKPDNGVCRECRNREFLESRSRAASLTSLHGKPTRK
uniref:Toxin candidate TRINITY_DN15615_c0_g2_i1 n=1 Tax=Isarachnanthus nocturnus TaxID=1240238 RepID=A0A7G7WZ35_9CNID|nr:toxin candidate TRINITY_DN15615_c0_g2_i1 [Isarachnanthus nocturnus]